MRFLKNQDSFKFRVGDVLIKQTRWTLTNQFKTEVIPGVNTPKKFMYVFENELGIGYIKQLRVDGSGFTTTLVCTANFDPDFVRFQLDPDFVDHVLIGDEDFQYNREYINKKSFREEAVKKNMKLMIRTHSTAKRLHWLANLKPGDVFWAGKTLDDMIQHKYTVVHGVSDTLPLTIEVISEGQPLRPGRLPEDWFTAKKVMSQEPYPMEDPLCGHPK